MAVSVFYFSGGEQPEILEHSLPNPTTGPYICVESTDGALWISENLGDSIARFDPVSAAWETFDLPSGSKPVGLAARPEGGVWFAAQGTSYIGRMDRDGKFDLLPLPTAGASPVGMLEDDAGGVWFAEGNVGKLAHCNAQGNFREFSRGLKQDDKPLAIGERDGTIWASLVGGSAIAHMRQGGDIHRLQLPGSDRQPRALIVHPDGSVWFVETNGDSLGVVHPDLSIRQHSVGLADASLRGVTVGADKALWFTANASNKVGRMLTTGEMAGTLDIPTKASGARCIMAHSSGRLYFTEYDAGILAEIRLPESWINA
ncbi:virginiamycin B lyase family protein [Agrobacterium tumefaciens]|uniref:Virginiamycin B lyase n=1 Tax=Agrobacterium tumefaciens TaxID=358 RepID=A0A2L2LM40_AGRTU|nr:hypothetical protein [Agrobacterium tumefaciens]AVH45397.1 hypothetical protein At1D1609_53650 [Agrobacterium tumefaciens]NSY99126.1 hypothetical protein [Agrobacterium tumefaciens]